MPFVIAPPGIPPGTYLVDVRGEGPCHAHAVDLAAMMGAADGMSGGANDAPLPDPTVGAAPAGFDWSQLGRIAGSVLAGVAQRKGT